MSVKYTDFLSCCLYFTANDLARKMTKIADEAFKVTGLKPSYAIMVMIVNQYSGILQSQVAETMSLAPSTITRFVDKLEAKGLIYREVSGKTSQLFTTDAGKELNDCINNAWGDVYKCYCDVLGEEKAVELTKEIYGVNQILKG